MYTFIVDFNFFFQVFLDSNYLYKLFGPPIGPFFRFFVLYGRKIHFLLSNSAFFAKPKEILTKSMVCGRKCRTFYQNFFDFLSYMAGNCIFFWCQIQPNCAKPKEIIIKRSENHERFTKNSSIFSPVRTHFEQKFQLEKLFKMTISTKPH